MAVDPFKRIDDELRKDAGCGGEIDYAEQTSWLLFLKYLDSMENRRKLAAELQGKSYSYIIDNEYKWDTWAAPKKDGEIDYNVRMIGEDLLEFVNLKLYPYLAEFKQRAPSSDTIEYKIGEIFGELKNKIQYGKTLANVIDIIDQFSFGSNADKHEMSQLYEEKIKRMGNAGRNGGEYYTPRPLIRAMIEIAKPKIGDTIYDGAVGSAGFLCEAHEYLKSQSNLSTSDLETLQKKTFYGKEKKGLAYVIGIMNMILHGIDAPNIIHTNTLGENVMDIQEKDRHNVVLANPPFGGGERKEIQQNFPIRTGETAYLFLQHFMKILKVGGTAAIVIKNTFLSNDDASELRKDLLSSCNLHTILDCPAGTFQGAGVKTVILFFNKGTPTRKIWYYQLKPGRNLGKTNPLNDKDLAEFIEFQKGFADSDNSWTIDIDDVDTSNYDLSTKNPNVDHEVVLRSPTEILDEIEKLDDESREILKKIRELL
ncbi:type I restriction-modification system subunit M [Euryarchaeota archaeon]|nr:type I restriction-modification system subunit M [Euryarchaeota archaeon]|tara:strand:+ start:109 stop:1554 length:1446 start_codon:yes stop_codon:yes gene_type:complete